jgi:hypothetical protein
VKCLLVEGEKNRIMIGLRAWTKILTGLGMGVRTLSGGASGFCLQVSGNKSQFIDGWEWSLKSNIVNVPLDANLHIHIIVDADAADAIDKKIAESGLVTEAQQPWRNEIAITLNNVEGMVPKWRLFLKHDLSNSKWYDR